MRASSQREMIGVPEGFVEGGRTRMVADGAYVVGDGEGGNYPSSGFGRHCQIEISTGSMKLCQR